MLTKVNLIRDIGRFTELKHKAPDLKKFAFIYALNGHGKSTLCSVLRSAASSDANLVLERVRLGAGSAPSVTTTWQTIGAVTYTSGKWNTRPPRVQIFDGEFIRRNIHVAEEVTRDNKRSLLRVIVGASGVALAEAINKTDDEIDRLTKELQEKDRAIKLLHPNVSDVEAFCARTIPAEIDGEIEALRRDVTAARLGSDVRNRPSPQVVPTPLQDKHAHRALLAPIGEPTGASLEGIVQSHMTKHGMTARGRPWLRFGVEHAAGADCPFCDQGLSNSPIISALRTYFSEAVKEVGERLDATLPELVRLTDQGSGSIRSIFRSNESLLSFWRTATELPAVGNWSEETFAAVEGGLRALAEALEQKRRSPLEGVILTPDKASAIEGALDLIESYNGKIRACIDRVERLKENPSHLDAAVAERSLSTMVALAERRNEPLKKLVEARTKLAQEKLLLTKKKDADKKALKENMASTATEHEKEINKLLRLFGASFTLCDTKASYIGREPNSEYCIDLSGQVLKVGPSPKTPEPSFKTVLSAGDKSALALAFFVARILADPKIADTTVIFDDPFSSQDHFRQVETGRQLRLIAAQAKQVVVFSHDINFIERTYRDAKKAETSIHQIIMEGPGKAGLFECDIEAEMKLMYVRRADRIRLYASTAIQPPDCSLSEIQTDLRSFMEEYVDLRNPGRFPKLTMLDAMIDAIETKGDDDPLHPHCDDLRAINEFSRPDHHKGASIPDPIQLRAKCQQVIDIIGAY